LVTDESTENVGPENGGAKNEQSGGNAVLENAGSRSQLVEFAGPNNAGRAFTNNRLKTH